MKNKLFYLMVVVMTTLFAGNSYAQEYATEEAVPWENHAVAIENAANESEGVYLCYKYQEGGETRYGFVTAGADNGTRGILTNRGLRFDVSGSNSSGFKFKSVQRNPNQDDNGSYLGYPSGLFSSDDVYLDQDTQWEVSGDLTNGYQIYVEGGFLERDHYLTVQNGLLTTSNSSPSGRWFIIPRTEFKEVVLNVERQTNIDVCTTIHASCVIFPLKIHGNGWTICRVQTDRLALSEKHCRKMNTIITMITAKILTRPENSVSEV